MPRRPSQAPLIPAPDDPEARSATAEPAPSDIETPPPVSEAGDDTASPDETALLGAYVLGALSPEERSAVEQRTAASPALQEELRRLVPVAALLREATDTSRRVASTGPAAPLVELTAHPGVGLDTGAATESASSLPVVPSHDTHIEPGDVEPVRPSDGQAGSPVATPLPRHDELSALDRVISGFPDEGGASVVRVEAAPGSLSSRPSGRRRPTAAAARPRPARGPRTGATWPSSRIAAGLATLVAVGAVLWALTLVDRVDSRQREIDALSGEVSRLRQRGDAAVVPLAPSGSGPAEADGVVVLVPSEGSLVVRASGLSPSAEGRVYQIWFQDGTDAPWLLGPDFEVGDDGTILAELPVAAPPFTRVAVSEEPSPGSDQPSGDLLLEGVTAAAG